MIIDHIDYNVMIDHIEMDLLHRMCVETLKHRAQQTEDTDIYRFYMLNKDEYSLCRQLTQFLVDDDSSWEDDIKRILEIKNKKEI